jgi:hypothetical protein
MLAAYKTWAMGRDKEQSRERWIDKERTENEREREGDRA